MKHAEHKKQVDALKRRFRTMGEMITGMADEKEEEKVEKPKKKK